MIPRGQAIALVGFMGTGKSSAGRELARRYRCPRFDIDEIVVAKFGLPITEIFSRFGEEKFREAETEALQQCSGRVRCVVVTGGGILLQPENRKLIRALGTVVELTADEETLFRRISRRATRPLLHTENPRATLVQMMHARQPLYADAADCTVDTSRLTHSEVATEIVRLIATQRPM